MNKLNVDLEIRNDRVRKKIIGTNVLYTSIITNSNMELHNKGIKTLMAYVTRHISDMSGKLATPAPFYRIMFNKEHEEEFIKISHISKDHITKAIRDCKMIKDDVKTMTNPFYTLCSALIDYHDIHKTVVDGFEVSKILNLYLTLRCYKAAFGSIFPSYLPNQDVMEYTIAHLRSNRYNIKKYSSVYDCIKYYSESHYDYFQDIRENPIDDNVIYYVLNIYNRVKMLVRGIGNEYYENHRKGLRMTDDDMMGDGDEEGDTYLRVLDNVSTQITVSTRKVYLSFISSSTCNLSVAKKATSATKLSFSKTVTTLNKIVAEREPLVEDLYNNIFSYYFSNNGKDIRSRHFISTMLKVFGVTNTGDANILKIKEIVEFILNKYSEEYRKSGHASTISNFKKCIFLYCVLYAVEIE